MAEVTDMLNKERVLFHLPPATPVTDLTVTEVIPSTNTALREAAQAGAPHGTVLIAASQSAGRGRRGRTFFSPDGTGLYISVLLRPTIAAGRMSKTLRTIFSISPSGRTPVP